MNRTSSLLVMAFSMAWVNVRSWECYHDNFTFFNALTLNEFVY